MMYYFITSYYSVPELFTYFDFADRTILRSKLWPWAVVIAVYNDK